MSLRFSVGCAGDLDGKGNCSTELSVQLSHCAQDRCDDQCRQRVRPSVRRGMYARYVNGEHGDESERERERGCQRARVCERKRRREPRGWQTPCAQVKCREKTRPQHLHNIFESLRGRPQVECRSGLQGGGHTWRMRTSPTLISRACRGGRSSRCSMAMPGRRSRCSRPRPSPKSALIWLDPCGLHRVGAWMDFAEHF